MVLLATVTSLKKSKRYDGDSIFAVLVSSVVFKGGNGGH
jgi:hypothetical protein